MQIHTNQLTGISSSFFQPYDAERYSVHFSNDTTEPLTSDQVNLVNNGAQVNFTGLSASGSNNVTVNSTLRKQGIVSKTKEYVRSKKVEVREAEQKYTDAEKSIHTKNKLALQNKHRKDEDALLKKKADERELLRKKKQNMQDN